MKKSEIMRIGDMGCMEVNVWVPKDIRDKEVTRMAKWYLSKWGYGTVQATVRGDTMKYEGRTFRE